MTPSKQLSFWEQYGEDERPLPLIVADKWGFSLTHVDPTGDPSDYLYCARDWYIELGGRKGNWSTQKTDWLYELEPVEIEVKRHRRKPETMEFVTAEGLYSIAQRMYRKGKTISSVRAEILDYLAKAGVKFDEIRRDPDQATDFIDALEHHHQIRRKGIVTRNDLMAWCRAAYGRGFAFGHFTNVEYKGLFGRTADELRQEAGVKNAREAMTSEALSFVDIAESHCLRLLKGREEVPEGEAFNIMRQVAAILAPSIEALQQQSGIDLATGKLLLEVGI